MVLFIVDKIPYIWTLEVLFLVKSGNVRREEKSLSIYIPRLYVEFTL